jgi:photosystem II biogenesis protein Psp29
LGDRQTIADSKRAFHQAFPHVIAPLYRRVSDELLVELHLLSHQTQFNSTPLFAVGLDKVFATFTRGYRPQGHPDRLFEAICSSNGFDANALKQQASQMRDAASASAMEGVTALLSEQRLPEGSHYSRMMAIGLLSVLESARGSQDSPDDEALVKQAVGLCSDLNLPAERVEKDLTLFASNSERMEQAVELMEETLASDRRKREQRQDAAAQDTSS